MATDVVFSQSNYEDSPSTNTPINATNLNTTVQGVRDTVVRANASVPFDNIIAVEDAGAITQRGTYVADVVDVSNLNQSLIGNEKRFLLWGNPNLMATFSPQTISLDLTQYDAIEIVFSMLTKASSTGAIYSIPTGIINASKKNDSIGAIGTRYDGGVYVSLRKFKFTDTGVIFEAGNQNGVTNNERMIPMNIYGIKY